MRVIWRCLSPGCVPRRCRLVWRGGRGSCSWPLREWPIVGSRRRWGSASPRWSPGGAATRPGGVRGLEDAPRSGCPRQVPRERGVAATLAPPPKRYGVTHWSSRLLARHLGIGNATVARVWRSYGIQPWRSGTFKYSTDPERVAKVTDVVGLYLAPPDNAVVLCVDEKSQIQALDRTAPMLPMQPGRIGAAHPRVHPARNLHPVRRPGGRHRPRHSHLQAPPPQYRAARLPAPGHACLPRRRAVDCWVFFGQCLFSCFRLPSSGPGNRFRPRSGCDTLGLSEDGHDCISVRSMRQYL